jgi:ABC-2 type transport system permease protein
VRIASGAARRDQPGLIGDDHQLSPVAIRAADELADELAGHARGEQRVAGRHDPDPGQQVVGLILGILAAGSEFRHRTIVPFLFATPHRARVFAVKVIVIAALGAAFAALVFGLGLETIVLTLSAHGIHHLPDGVGRLYAGTVISSACFGMIGVALGALTRNTIAAIVAAIVWTLFVEQVILAAIVPGVEKWLPTAAAIGLTNAPGPGTPSPVVAGLVLAGYAVALLAAASRTTMRRDVT